MYHVSTAGIFSDNSIWTAGRFYTNFLQAAMKYAMQVILMLNNFSAFTLVSRLISTLANFQITFLKSNIKDLKRSCP